MTRGKHFAACPNFGSLNAEGCRGCVPADAMLGALICERCFTRVRRILEDVPDVVAIIRSLADPLKSGWNMDREIVGGSRGDEAPAPVRAELIDAGDWIIATLRSWAGGGQRGFVAGVESDEAYDAALGCVETIVIELPAIANTKADILALCAVVVDMPPADQPDGWTFARALNRWPVADRAYWAARPCPLESCGLRAMKVTPPRVPGRPTRFHCEKCGWSPANDDDGFWADAFSGKVGQAA